MIVPSPSHALLLLLFGGVFIHFLQAGARTFSFNSGDAGAGGAIGQFSFLVTGLMAAWGVGLRMPMQPANQVVALLLLIVSVSLYEWARRTIWGRHFGLALSEQVPDALCDSGPYRHIRHPIYLSYVLAFLALLIALPHWATTLGFLFNLVVCVVFARSDERVLAGSALAADYAAYRLRTGMFFPKLKLSPAAPDR
jgi:protein-S-isoprenylcysteine O-methyltransferase Ste14